MKSCMDVQMHLSKTALKRIGEAQVPATSFYGIKPHTPFHQAGGKNAA